MEKKRSRDAFKAVLVHDTATIVGVSERHVRRVISGTTDNEAIMTIYMELEEGRNKLLDAVKQLVPFEGHKPVELQVEYKTFTH